MKRRISDKELDTLFDDWAEGRLADADEALVAETLLDFIDSDEDTGSVSGEAISPAIFEEHIHRLAAEERGERDARENRYKTRRRRFVMVSVAASLLLLIAGAGFILRSGKSGGVMSDTPPLTADNRTETPAPSTIETPMSPEEDAPAMETPVTGEYLLAESRTITRTAPVSKTEVRESVEIAIVENNDENNAEEELLNAFAEIETGVSQIYASIDREIDINFDFDSLIPNEMMSLPDIGLPTSDDMPWTENVTGYEGGVQGTDGNPTEEPRGIFERDLFDTLRKLDDLDVKWVVNQTAPENVN